MKCIGIFAKPTYQNTLCRGEAEAWVYAPEAKPRGTFYYTPQTEG